MKLLGKIRISFFHYFLLAFGLLAAKCQILIWSAEPPQHVFNLDDSGVGTLRSAITFANTSGSTQEIQFIVSGTLLLTNPLPNITGNLQIRGAPDGTTVRAPTKANIFSVQANASLRLQGVILTGGEAREGGAIRNDGTVVVYDSTFLSNSATGPPLSGRIEPVTGGGAIWNSGSLTLQRCVFDSNRATGTSTNGGALFNTNGTVLVAECTFTNNLVRPAHVPANWGPPISGGDAFGGAVALYGGRVVLEASTFVNNSAIALEGQYGGKWAGTTTYAQVGGSAAGAALVARGTDLSITNCTFSGNQARANYGGIQFGELVMGTRYPDRPLRGGDASGGAIWAAGGSLSAVNCSFISNTVFSPSGERGGQTRLSALAADPVTANLQNNLFSGNLGSLDEFPATPPSQRNLVVPGKDVLPLANNGGLTFTHSLDWTSVAIDSGASVVSPTFDQRGVLRPQRGAVDIGAVEILPEKPTLIDFSPDEVVYLGTNLTLFANFSGTVPITVTWFKGSNVISSGSSQTLQLVNISALDAGQYWANAKNSEGEVSTPEISIRVETKSHVIISGTPFVCEGESVVLRSDIFALTPYSIQWFHNGKAISKGGESVLRISAMSARHEGEYFVHIINALGEYRSPPFLLRLWPEILVTNLNDSGAGSLRAAIESLTTTPEALRRTIRISTPGIISLAAPLPIITTHVSFIGGGAHQTEINGAGKFPLLSFAPSSVATLHRLKLAQGRTSPNGSGGAINNLGVLSISNCWFRLNTSTGGFGGAIYTSNTLNLQNSFFELNSAIGTAGFYHGAGAGLGGALFVDGGSALIINCTFDQNFAQGGGTALHAQPPPSAQAGTFGYGGLQGTLTTRDGHTWIAAPGQKGGFGGGGGGGVLGWYTQRNDDGTLIEVQGSPGGQGGFAGGIGASGAIAVSGGNHGIGGGGGGIGGAIFAKAGVLEIVNCTIVKNHASGGVTGGAATPGIGVAGGIFNYGATVSLQNTILASNSANTNAELAGLVVSRGFNLFRQATPAFSGLSSDLIGIDPLLPGSPIFSSEVPCYVPLSGSPLIDRGRSPVSYDQRSQLRQVNHPTSLDYPGGDVSDIGAVEVDLDQRIISFEHRLDHLRLTFNTIPGRSYNVRYRSDLLSSWQVLPETILGTGHWITITNLPILTPAGFFQIGSP